MWSKKQKRCFHRICSGLTYHLALGRRIRFITLTSSKESPSNIQRSFHILKYRLKRKYGKFEYIKVRTNEGYGVLHILYIGAFIPHSVLQGMWYDIHHAWDVDIRHLYGSAKDAARYVVSQYLSNQRCSFIRYSWSWGWLFKGFVKFWHKLILYFSKEMAIKKWNALLQGCVITYLVGYLKLVDGKLKHFYLDEKILDEFCEDGNIYIYS